LLREMRESVVRFSEGVVGVVADVVRNLFV